MSENKGGLSEYDFLKGHFLNTVDGLHALGELKPAEAVDMRELALKIDIGEPHKFREMTQSLLLMSQTVKHVLDGNKAVMKRLEDLAYNDQLTKVMSRTGMNASMKRRLAAMERSGVVKAGFVFLDLDGFKQINDKFGHDRGDEMLVKVARALVKNLRDADLISRYGGDEFAIYMPYTADYKQPLTEEKIRNILDNVFNTDDLVAWYGDLPVPLWYSAGVLMLDQEQLDAIEQMTSVYDPKEQKNVDIDGMTLVQKVFKIADIRAYVDKMNKGPRLEARIQEIQARNPSGPTYEA